MSIIIVILLVGVGIRIVGTMMPSMDVVPVVENPDLFSRRVQRVMREADQVLAECSPYYSQLSPAGKEKFKERMRVVTATKKFYTPKEEKLTAEKVLLTCASYVQLTYGLENWRLPYMRAFVIYDDLVSEKYYPKKYKGLASESGWIRLSWKYLKSGHADPNDGVNLGLHELAHGIEISINQDQILSERLARSFADFEDHFHEIRNDELKRKLDLFSKRDLSIRTEFFASAVEVFFERPQELKDHHPGLYDLLCYSLGQDPMNVHSDFQLESGHALRLESGYGKKRKKNPYYDPIEGFGHQTIIQFFIVSGLILGYPMLFVYGVDLYAPAEAILSVFAVMIMAGILIFKKKLLDSEYTSTFSFSIFLLLGWVPFTAAFMLVMNDLITLEEHVDRYPIENGRYDGEYHGFVVKVDDEDPNVLPKEFRYLRSSLNPMFKAHRGEPMDLLVYRRTGLFLLDIYEGNNLRVEVRRDSEVSH